MSRHISLTDTAATTRALYDEYGGMLLGYIVEVVKDENLAGQYLVSVFNEVPTHLHNILQPGANIYQRLLLLTRRVMAGFFETIPACNPADKNAHLPSKPNKFLARMNEEQQFIFCSIYYNGISITTLAAELSQPEQAIRKTLQQAFAAMRRAS